jgi:hypothetical protein
MEDLDEAGQVQSRSTPDGTATIKRSGRVQWQLHSLRWLQARVAQAPRITDSLDTWFKPALARRLRVAGIPTLLTLTARINGIGTLWWLDVPGMSEKKAGHIVAWLRTHEGSLRLGDGNHINPRRTVLVAARQTRAALL